MKKEQVIANAYESLIKRLESTEKFVVEQAPDVCKEIIKEKLLDETINVLTYSFGLIVGIIITFIGIHYSLDTVNPNYIRFPLGFVSFVSICSIFPTSGSLIDSINRLLIIKMCPKLTLIRQLKRLIQ